MYTGIKLGFCPIGKFVFSHDDAKLYKKLIEEKMDRMGIHYVTIDDVIKDGIIRTHDDVGPAVDFLKSQNVDCIFLPHCNFGTESAAGLIGKKMGVPVLLWGPRDNAPQEDGTRLRDTLCGLFASSKILTKLGVPFTYIENCEVEDSIFHEGLDTFIRVSNVVKKFKNARIGIIGNRIDFFWSTIVNENELLQKFGIEVLPFDLVKVVRMTRELAEENRRDYLNEIVELKKRVNLVAISETGIVNVLALRDVMYRLAVENKLTALAVESFMSITEELDAMISFAQAMVTDMGIPCICESDIHGAISSIIAEAAALNTRPSFFADLTVRHPENDQGLLLWHDSFPISLKAPDSEASIGIHWILPGINPGMCHWRLKEGEITIIRFDGEFSDYKLMAHECRTVAGPYTQNTYVWVEIPEWKQFERKIIEGPYIHHTACIYGNFSNVMKEACKYITGLSFDSVGRD